MNKQQQKIIADIKSLASEVVLVHMDKYENYEAFLDNIGKLLKAADLVEDCFIPKDLL